MISHNGKEIIYTFKYGEYLSKKQKYLLIISSGTLIFLGILLFIILAIYDEMDTALISLILMCSLGLISSITTIKLCHTGKHDKDIAEWLTDKNLFETTVEPWEFSSTSGGVFKNRYRFGIDFVMNDNPYRMISAHYDNFYKFIKGKSITILYSPEYDQVMVLENENKGLN